MFSGELPITSIVSTKNEEKNIQKCLDSLKPVSRCIIVDSQSSDRTLDIASQNGAEVVQFYYKGGYPKKRQWALDNISIETEWVLLVDADEVIPDKLWSEITKKINDSKTPEAFFITKRFHFLRKNFNYGGFSHSAILLFKNGFARFERILEDSGDGLDMEVHERIIVKGRTDNLSIPLIHEDYNNLESYLDRHNKYSTWEAKLRYKFIESTKYGEDTIKPKLFGNAQERRRFLKRIAIKIPFEPSLWFLYHYILRLGFLEGKRGLIASRLRANYISQVRYKIYEMKKLKNNY